jgi:hypothetical protein
MIEGPVTEYNKDVEQGYYQEQAYMGQVERIAEAMYHRFDYPNLEMTRKYTRMSVANVNKANHQPSEVEIQLSALETDVGTEHEIDKLDEEDEPTPAEILQQNLSVEELEITTVSFLTFSVQFLLLIPPF